MGNTAEKQKADNINKSGMLNGVFEKSKVVARYAGDATLKVSVGGAILYSLYKIYTTIKDKASA